MLLTVVCAVPVVVTVCCRVVASGAAGVATFVAIVGAVVLYRYRQRMAKPVDFNKQIELMIEQGILPRSALANTDDDGESDGDGTRRVGVGDCSGS